MIQINENKITAEIMRLAGGRIILAVAGAAVVGFLLGALFF